MIPQILAALKAIGGTAAAVGKTAGAFGKGLLGMSQASRPLAMIGPMTKGATTMANVMKGANSVGQALGAVKGTDIMSQGSTPISMVKKLLGGQTEGEQYQENINQMSQTPFSPIQQQNATASVPITFAPYQRPLPMRRTWV